MENLLNLDPTSRTCLLLLLSIACVGLIAFAFRRKGPVHKVRVAWRLGRMAAQQRREAEEQTKQAEIDQLNLSIVRLNRGEELDPASLLDLLEKRLTD